VFDKCITATIANHPRTHSKKCQSAEFMHSKNKTSIRCSSPIAFLPQLEKCSINASRQQLPIIHGLAAKSADLLSTCTRKTREASDVHHRARSFFSFFWHAFLSQKYSLPDPTAKARLPAYALPQKAQGGCLHASQYGDSSAGAAHFSQRIRL